MGDCTALQRRTRKLACQQCSNSRVGSARAVPRHHQREKEAQQEGKRRAERKKGTTTKGKEPEGKRRDNQRNHAQRVSEQGIGPRQERARIDHQVGGRRHCVVQVIQYGGRSDCDNTLASANAMPGVGSLARRGKRKQKRRRRRRSRRIRNKKKTVTCKTENRPSSCVYIYICECIFYMNA